MISKEVLISDLELCGYSEVYVEVNGTIHTVCEVQDTSQGAIIVVDTLEEERELRPGFEGE